MADRVIQRNDTAARWQSINPILATGEIGIEIDGAKGYKIGDGKTRWNDLPYPANPTNVVQDLGNNENAVPSQKLVTEKLTELGSELRTSLKGSGGNSHYVAYPIKAGVRYYVKVDTIGNSISMSTKTYLGSDNIETVADSKTPLGVEFVFNATMDANGISMWVSGVQSDTISHISIRAERVIGKEEKELKLGSRILSEFRFDKLSIIGDSISTFNDGNQPNGYAMYYPQGDVKIVDDTYWKILSNILNGNIEVNASYSGSYTTNVNADRPSFYHRTSMLGNPDTIIVAMGTNDSKDKVALGEFDFDSDIETLDESTFRTAYIKGVKSLKNNYPKANIICCIMKMSADYEESIKIIADYFSIPYVICKDYKSTDNLHPNKEGMEYVAHQIASFGVLSNIKSVQKDIKSIYDYAVQKKSRYFTYKGTLLRDFDYPIIAGRIYKITVKSELYEGKQFQISTKDKNFNNVEVVANYNKEFNKPFYFTASKDAVGLGIYVSTGLAEDEYELIIEGVAHNDIFTKNISNQIESFKVSNRDASFSFDFIAGKEYLILCKSKNIDGLKNISISTKDADNINLETIDSYTTPIGEVIYFHPNHNSTKFGIWIGTVIDNSSDLEDFYIFIAERVESVEKVNAIVNSDIEKITKVPIPIGSDRAAFDYDFKVNYDYEISVVSTELSGSRFSISSKINNINVESIAEYNLDFNKTTIFSPKIYANRFGLFTQVNPTIEGTEIVIAEKRKSIAREIKEVKADIQKVLSNNVNARPVIFDTDFAWDVDDVVSTRILAWGVRTGRVKLLGVNLSKVNNLSVSAMDGLLCEEGLNNVAISKGTRNGTRREYHTILSNYPTHTRYSNDDAISPVELYRRKLVELEDGEKADIIIVGVLTDFVKFLKSTADGISSLNGIELASEKINRVWIMGGNYNTDTPSKTEANFREDGDNVIYTLSNCPVPIILQGSEIAENPSALNCGRTIKDTMGKEDYVYQSLTTWNEEVGHWCIAYDPMLVLAAIDGSSYITQLKLERGVVTYHSDTQTTSFTNDENGTHYVTRKIMSNDFYTKRLDFILNKFSW